MISREEALKLLRQKLRNEKLIKHCIAVEAIMKKLAEHLGKDVNLWMLVGLLHDLDYEETKNDFSKHGIVSAEMLKGKLPNEAVEAISAHNDLTGIKAKSDLAIALRAADQLSGLIIAAALVMPNKKLEEVKVDTLKRKIKQKDFARRVDRQKIKQIEEIGVALDDFLQIGLDALKGIHEELGL